MQIKGKLPLIFGVPGQPFFENFKAKRAFVAELRPGLEGSRLVAKELLKKKIQPVIICDNMMAFCMSRGLVKDVHIFYNARNKKSGLCRTGSHAAVLSARLHRVPAYLYQAAALPLRVASLLKIDGLEVTSKNIQTYVPLLEEVPLGLVLERRI